MISFHYTQISDFASIYFLNFLTHLLSFRYPLQPKSASHVGFSYPSAKWAGLFYSSTVPCCCIKLVNIYHRM
ncbi:hypothetical protein R3P38DRAFT_2823566, partial [Favolaschia claudopus]